MFLSLFLLFTILPVLELVVLIKVGTAMGALNTVILVIFISALGAFLARLQGFLVLKEIQKNLNQGIMPSSQLIDGFMILAGGILLLTPGFITDILGLLLLIPWTRAVIKFLLKKKFKSMLERGEIISVTSLGQKQKRYKDIDI